jgi:hypothetical protein
LSYVKPKLWGRSSLSFEEELYLNDVVEYTHSSDFKQRIPFYDRPSSSLTAANKLKEFLLSPSYGGREEKVYYFIDWENRSILSSPQNRQKYLVINCREFPSIGPESISRFVVAAHELGWKKFITFGWRGQKFRWCGLSSQPNDVRIEVHGIPGDPLASGLDGAEIIVYGSAGNRAGQKMKGGRLVIYGNTGHNFMEEAKGGEAYVLGNVSGRPLARSSGSPKVVINGTIFDQSDEPGQKKNWGRNSGFIVLNGLTFDEKGEIEDSEAPYSKRSLLSMFSGQTLYVRDPFSKIKEFQIPGVRILDLTEKDCLNIFPCLKENEKLFNIDVLDLITVKNQLLPFHKVYRKVESIESRV